MTADLVYQVNFLKQNAKERNLAYFPEKNDFLMER